MEAANIIKGVMYGWGKVLAGATPLLSIEITKLCPLTCPGCYAFAPDHVGDGVDLESLSDFRGPELVKKTIDLVNRHDAMHVSLVGGEPMVRVNELREILPQLSADGRHVLVVTSAVVPIPKEWMDLKNLTIGVSIDGLPEHHDERRKPATYEKILKNIEGCRINVHWTITRQMLQRPSYMEEYVKFWYDRTEVRHIWASIFSPQVGENAAEILTQDERRQVVTELVRLGKLYPKLTFPKGLGEAYLQPPADPQECTFANLSRNYSADLKSRVEPCILGGTPDCSQCACIASGFLHAVQRHKLPIGLKVNHLLQPSLAMGRFFANLRGRDSDRVGKRQPKAVPLVSIQAAPKKGALGD
jgi:organic radical activating enzyme